MMVYYTEQYSSITTLLWYWKDSAGTCGFDWCIVFNICSPVILGGSFLEGPFQFWVQLLSQFKTGCSLDKQQLHLHALHMIYIWSYVLHAGFNFLNFNFFLKSDSSRNVSGLEIAVTQLVVFFCLVFCSRIIAASKHFFTGFCWNSSRPSSGILSWFYCFFSFPGPSQAMELTQADGNGMGIIPMQSWFRNSGWALECSCKCHPKLHLNGSH